MQGLNSCILTTYSKVSVMINSITENGTYNSLFAQRGVEAGTENSFADALSAAVEGCGDELLNAAPDKWLHEWTGESPVKKAVEFLENMGVGVKSREPSHSLTDEQKEWLRSRNDLDAIYNSTASPLDRYNFRADLVYLGVISPDEAENIGVGVIPTHCTPNEIMLLNTEKSGNYIDNLRGIMSKQKSVVDYMREKYNDPLRRQDEDLRYIEAAQRLIDIHELYIGLMEDLFG